jgi:hypothetical protein
LNIRNIQCNVKSYEIIYASFLRYNYCGWHNNCIKLAWPSTLMWVIIIIPFLVIKRHRKIFVIVLLLFRWNREKIIIGYVLLFFPLYIIKDISYVNCQGNKSTWRHFNISIIVFHRHQSGVWSDFWRTFLEWYFVTFLCFNTVLFKNVHV